MRRIAIILENSPGCELDRTVLTLSDDDEEAHRAIHDELAGWTLEVGDTIRIIEVC